MAWFEELESEHIDSSSWFPGSSSVLDGFDSPLTDLDPGSLEENGLLAEGDQILYGVSIERPEERKAWLVHMEVIDFFDGIISARSSTGEKRSSIAARLRITLYDEEGVRLGQNESRAAAMFLRMGLHAGSEAGFETSRSTVSEDSEVKLADYRKSGNEAVLAFASFIELVCANDLLFPILKDAMPMPSLFGLLVNFGVNVSGGLVIKSAIPYEGHEAADWGGDTFRVPVIFYVNDDPALYCTFAVAPSRSPLHVGAGIVSVVGKRPGNDPLRCRLQLLAARRGG